MDNYEAVLEQITALPKAPAGGARDIRWISGSSTLGAARDQAGRLEIFLTGPRLTPFSHSLRDAMQHHDWRRTTGDSFSANRLLLPAMGHFDHLGAFICTELLRNDVQHDVIAAFQETEPIIELAIKRLEISENALLGLMGELLILNALVQQAPDTHVGQALHSWSGWHRSKRDFTWGHTGVEVKATRRTNSIHHVQGIHQVDAYPETDDGLVENRLLLVSIGLSDAEPASHALSIPQLVEKVVVRLEESGHGTLGDEFLQHVAQYGSESGFGYEHAAMSHDAPFTNAFGLTFCRAYDMGDPLIHVIRHDTMMSYPQVDAHSVSFTVNLPPTVTGQNPVQGPNQIASLILA